MVRSIFSPEKLSKLKKLSELKKLKIEQKNLDEIQCLKNRHGQKFWWKPYGLFFCMIVACWYSERISLTWKSKFNEFGFVFQAVSILSEPKWREKRERQIFFLAFHFSFEKRKNVERHFSTIRCSVSKKNKLDLKRRNSAKERSFERSERLVDLCLKFFSGVAFFFFPFEFFLCHLPTVSLFGKKEREAKEMQGRSFLRSQDKKKRIFLLLTARHDVEIVFLFQMTNRKRIKSFPEKRRFSSWFFCRFSFQFRKISDFRRRKKNQTAHRCRRPTEKTGNLIIDVSWNLNTTNFQIWSRFSVSSRKFWPTAQRKKKRSVFLFSITELFFRLFSRFSKEFSNVTTSWQKTNIPTKRSAFRLFSCANRLAR